MILKVFLPCGSRIQVRSRELLLGTTRVRFGGFWFRMLVPLLQIPFHPVTRRSGELRVNRGKRRNTVTPPLNLCRVSRSEAVRRRTAKEANMFCTDCGKPNQDGAKFCFACGKVIGAASVPAAASSLDSQKQ